MSFLIKFFSYSHLLYLHSVLGFIVLFLLLETDSAIVIRSYMWLPCDTVFMKLCMKYYTNNSNETFSQM